MASEEEIIGKVGDYMVTFDPAIGRGVYGTVHKTIHIESKNELAAKQLILFGCTRDKEKRLEMAKDELAMIQRVQGHPNIVALHDHMKIRNAYWIFMEMCDLGDLHNYMEYTPNIDMTRKINFMIQAADAIAYMHKQNPPIVHRDIKPQNIMLKTIGDDHVIKLTDFGFSKLVHDRKTLSIAFGQGAHMSSLCGSQYFMAPEFSAELDSGLKYDKSVDTFASGLVFLVLLNCEVYRDLIPLSAERRSAGTYVSIGYEMVSCFKEGKPLPTVIKSEATDSLRSKQLKRIVRSMSKFKANERKCMDEVVLELEEVLEQMILDAKHGEQEKKASNDIIKLKSQLVDVSKELEKSRSNKAEANEGCSMFPKWMLSALGDCREEIQIQYNAFQSTMMAKINNPSSVFELGHSDWAAKAVMKLYKDSKERLGAVETCTNEFEAALKNIRPKTYKGCFGIKVDGVILSSNHEIIITKNSPVWITVEPRHTFESVHTNLNRINSYRFALVLKNKNAVNDECTVFPFSTVNLLQRKTALYCFMEEGCYELAVFMFDPQTDSEKETVDTRSVDETNVLYGSRTIIIHDMDKRNRNGPIRPNEYGSKNLIKTWLKLDEHSNNDIISREQIYKIFNLCVGKSFWGDLKETALMKNNKMTVERIIQFLESKLLLMREHREEPATEAMKVLYSLAFDPLPPTFIPYTIKLFAENDVEVECVEMSRVREKVDENGFRAVQAMQQLCYHPLALDSNVMRSLLEVKLSVLFNTADLLSIFERMLEHGSDYELRCGMPGMAYNLEIHRTVTDDAADDAASKPTKIKYFILPGLYYKEECIVKALVFAE